MPEQPTSSTFGEDAAEEVTEVVTATEAVEAEVEA
jgi:hypothetical protein